MLTFEHLGDWGRLGNQMFKYAALRGIADKNNLSFVIPSKQSAGKVADEYQVIDSFNINAEISDFVNQETISEASFAFDEELFNNCPDNVNLNGGFQSYKYFEHIADEIREEFKFKKEYNVPPGDYVAVHVRRGDYAKDPNHHPMLKAEYYEAAMEHFPGKRMVVVSDDFRWCIEQEVFHRAQIFVGTSNLHDLYLMTKASGHIIANSTFSWWGAWLAESEKVIAPKNWFGSALKELDLTDLRPKDWILI